MLWLIWLIPILVTPILAGAVVWWQTQPRMGTTPIREPEVAFSLSRSAGAERPKRSE